MVFCVWMRVDVGIYVRLQQVREDVGTILRRGFDGLAVNIEAVVECTMPRDTTHEELCGDATHCVFGPANRGLFQDSQRRGESHTE